jgi:Zn-dependent peptidase ImmA (M78 family)
VAFGGKGVILLDAQDPADEVRFSLAHEAAHFIIDYISPRKIAEKRFGVRILEVLDGCRLPTTQERGSALLSNTAIGVYRHLMNRSVDGKIECSRIERAERDADRLALELLAPEQIVQRVLSSSQTAHGSPRFRIVNCLKEYFGLPNSVAIRYSYQFGSVSKSRSVRNWLGIG